MREDVCVRACVCACAYACTGMGRVLGRGHPFMSACMLIAVRARWNASLPLSLSVFVLGCAGAASSAGAVCGKRERGGAACCDSCTQEQAGHGGGAAQAPQEAAGLHHHLQVHPPRVHDRDMHTHRLQPGELDAGQHGVR